MPEAGTPDRLRRLLAPRSVVVVGGRAAEVAARQSRGIGFTGPVWAVHPTRTSIDGLPCLRSVAELPEPPDAAFVAVPAAETVRVVGELAALGTGGVVCHASGFAEDGAAGRDLQRALVEAAGNMPLVGPNCLGLLNFLDGAALWPDQHGGERVASGVAVIAQSGNIAENLTMQRRALPLAAVVTIGNGAVTGVVDLVAGMLADPRITAIGLQLEAMPDPAGLSRVALEALRRKVPLVVLKTGSSELGARVTLSHTSSLAGSDVLADALFRRLGIARVHRVEAFVETLKLLHVHGALPGTRITSASCSGGEAAHVADLAPAAGVRLPALDEPTAARLHAVLGDRVALRNPLDYHTYVWGRREELTACFTALQGTEADVHLLMLDLPRADRCDVTDFETALAAFVAAQRARGSRACVVASLPEGLPEETGRRLVEAGVAPMQGVTDCLHAIAAAALVGAAQAGVEEIQPLGPLPQDVGAGDVAAGDHLLDEPAAKGVLAGYGLPVPVGGVTTAEDAPALAARIGFPVVVKAVSPGLAHKSDAGGVRLGLTSEASVREAATDLAALGPTLLVERMVPGAVLELVVGVTRDPQLGPALTVGAGGVLVELLDDAVSLLLPVSRADLHVALRRLRCWPVLAGYRGTAPDVEAVLDALESVVAFATDHAATLLEVEVNPLLVLPAGVVAVDAVVRLSAPLAASRGAA